MQCSECSRPVQGSGDTARQERSRADLPRSPRPQMETRRAVATDNAHVGSSHSRDRSKRLRGLPSRSACAVVAHSDRRHHAMATSAHCARARHAGAQGAAHDGSGRVRRADRESGTEMCTHRPLMSSCRAVSWGAKTKQKQDPFLSVPLPAFLPISLGCSDPVTNPPLF